MRKVCLDCDKELSYLKTAIRCKSCAAKFSFKNGRAQWNKGKNMSKEFCQKMSIIKMGNQARLNHKLSSDTKQKMSLAHTGISSKGWKKKAPCISTYARKLWLNNKRRVLKTKNGGSHTQIEWENLVEQYNHRCLACGRHEPEIVLTRDHIIPISKGGTDNIENLQPLCKNCNSKKRISCTNYRAMIIL